MNRAKKIIWRLCVTSSYSNSYQYLLTLLFQARKAAGMTQIQLAGLLQKPQSYVAKYEQGERRLDVIEFLAICKHFGADPHELLDAIQRKDIP